MASRACSLEQVKSYGKDSQKKPSILYAALRNHFKDDDIARRYHALAQQPQYKHLHVDSANLDETGELKMDAFLNLIYWPDVIKSKDKSSITEKISRIREMIDKRINILSTMLTSDDTNDGGRRRKLYIEMKALQHALEKGKLDEADFLVRFIDDMHRLVSEASVILDNIKDDGTTEFNADNIRDLVDIRNEFASLGVFENLNELIKEPAVKQTFDKINIERAKAGEMSFEAKIKDVIEKKNKAEKDYIEKAIPIQANWLLKYNSNTINLSVHALANNIRANNRGKYFVTKDDEYKKKTKEFKDGKLTKEQYDEALTHLAVQQLYDRSLITRKSLIEDMKRAYRDKSGFSLYFDPFIYTSNRTLGLFARALKEELYQAAKASKDTALQLENHYNKFLETTGRSAFNADKFNDGLFEEIEVYSPSHGKHIKRLSFIQEFDISKFNKNKKEFFDNVHTSTLNSLNKRNIKLLGLDYDKSQKEIAEWFTTEAGKKWLYHSKEGEKYLITKNALISNWYIKNTEPIADAQEQIKKKLLTRKALLREVGVLKKKKADNKELTYDEETILANAYVKLEENNQWFRANTFARSSDDVLIPKGPLAQPKKADYTNEKYNELLKPENKALLDYYNALLEQYKKDQRRLPSHELDTNSWNNFSYFLPSVPKNNKDIYIEAHGNLINAVKKDFHDAITITDTDTQFGITDETGSLVRKVPIFFVNPAEADYVSKDIVSSVLQFNHMVNEYKAKANIQAQVLAMQDIIDARPTSKTNSLGQRLIDAFAKKHGNPDDIDLKQKTNYSESLENYIDLIFYGEKSVDAMIGKISLTKLTSKLTGITSLNALAFNALQGTSNIVFGELMFFTEAMGAQFYNHSNLVHAKDLFWRQNHAGMDDLGKFNPKTKMGKLASQIYDPVQGKFLDSTGHNVTGSALKKAMQSDTLFFMQHGGEFEMQTQTMLAILDAMKVQDKDGKLLLKENSKEMTLYEAYEIDEKTGLIKLNDKVDKIVNKDGVEMTEADIRAIIHGINGKLHGKYNNADKTVLQRQWYGKLAFLFRGWLVPGIRKRWGFSLSGEPSMDFETGMISEGTYISFMRLIRESLKEKQSLISTFKRMSAMEQAGVVKTLTEITALIAAIAIVWGLSKLDGDDDDEEKTMFEEEFLAFFKYQARRLQSELLFYVNPSEFYKIMKSPSATINMIAKIMRVWDQLGSPMELYERQSGFNEKGDSKLWARFRDVLPVINNIEKSITPSESYEWFMKKW